MCEILMKGYRKQFKNFYQIYDPERLTVDFTRLKTSGKLIRMEQNGSGQSERMVHACMPTAA